MHSLFKVLLFALLPLSGFSQIIINNSGTPGVLNREPNRQVTSIFVVPVYSDTASALTKGVDSLGMIIQIRTTGAWYKRDTISGGVNGHYWNLVSAGGGGGSDSGISVIPGGGVKKTVFGGTIFLSVDSAVYTTLASRQKLSDSLQVLINTKQTKTLNAGQILIGNGSNLATAFTTTGAIAFSSSGVTTYNNNSLALVKIVTGTANTLIGYDGSGNPHEIAPLSPVGIASSNIFVDTTVGHVNALSTIAHAKKLADSLGALISGGGYGPTDTLSTLATQTALRDSSGIYKYAYSPTVIVEPSDSGVWVGDSYGVGTGASDSAHGYFSLLSTGLGALIKNFSVAGSTIEKQAPVDYQGALSFTERIGSISPNSNAIKFVILEGGLNSAGQTATAYNPTNYLAAWDTIANTLLVTKAYPRQKIFILGIPYIPQAGLNSYATITGNAAPTFARMRSYDSLNRLVAIKYNFKFIEQYDPVFLYDSTNIVLPQGIHPNDKGYKNLYSKIYQKMGYGNPNAGGGSFINNSTSLQSSANFNISGSGQAGSLLLTASGSGETLKAFNNQTTSGFSAMITYPNSGTNVANTFAVLPKGTGQSNNKSGFQIFGTDPIADGTNTESLQLLATGTSYSFLSQQTGTGSRRPIAIGMGTAPSVPTQLVFNTDGSLNTSALATKTTISTDSSVIRDASGKLWVAAIPGGGGFAGGISANQIAYGAGTNAFTSSANLSYNTTGIGVGKSSASNLLDMTGSANGQLAGIVTNTNSGTSAVAWWEAVNDASHLFTAGISSSAYTGVSEIGANSAFLYSESPGGWAIVGDNAAATFRVATGGQIERLKIDASGLFTVPSSSFATGTTTDSVIVETTSSGVMTLKKVAQSSVGSGFYQTVQSNTTSQTQRAKLNFGPQFTVADNSGNGSTDISITGNSADLTGRGAAATVLTFTNNAANSFSTYSVGGYITVTAISLDVVQLSVQWTDETNTSRTQAFFVQGATTGISTTGASGYSPIYIRSKQSTTITVSTVLTTSTGSITYDVGTVIAQLN